MGVIFIFVGFFGANLFGLNNYSAQTSATVVSVGQPSATTTDSNGNTSGGACSMTARYTVNGKSYTTTSSISSSSYCGNTPGSTLTISYNPNQPGKWATDIGTVKNIIKIFGYAGILVFLLSLFTFAIRVLSIIFGWKILKSGRALVKTLPGGSNLGSMVNQIREEFKHSLFNGQGATASTLQNALVKVVKHDAGATPLQTTQLKPISNDPTTPSLQVQLESPLVQPTSEASVHSIQNISQTVPDTDPLQTAPENTPPLLPHQPRNVTISNSVSLPTRQVVLDDTLKG